MTIDDQLAKAGWVVQSREQMNLGAGLGQLGVDGHPRTVFRMEKRQPRSVGPS